MDWRQSGHSPFYDGARYLYRQLHHYRRLRRLSNDGATTSAAMVDEGTSQVGARDVHGCLRRHVWPLTSHETLGEDSVGGFTCHFIGDPIYTRIERPLTFSEARETSSNSRPAHRVLIRLLTRSVCFLDMNYCYEKPLNTCQRIPMKMKCEIARLDLCR